MINEATLVANLYKEIISILFVISLDLSRIFGT